MSPKMTPILSEFKWIKYSFKLNILLYEGYDSCYQVGS